VRTRELESAPALPPLYAKAALGLIPGGGGELPEEALELAEATVDSEALADYARVCGFSLRDTLPPTYPHVLAFPVAMCLMANRSFPFALLGLVHVANRIDERRAVPVDARPGIRVWAENLRPHHRGCQVDVVTQVSLDGEVAWREASTYLRPGDGSGERPDRAADPLEGAETAAVWKVSGDIGRRYAAVSGDRNPIHLHALSARLFGFPTAIAHGMWTYARALASLDGQLPATHTSRVEFRSPLRIPGRARLLSRRRESGWDLAVSSPDGEHRHLELAVDC
jgi:acyl dehydratase